MLSGNAIAIAVLTTGLFGCGAVDTRPVPLAGNCAEWSRLDADQQLQTAQAVIEPGLLSTVRERQQLAADADDAEVFAAVRTSLSKVCEVDRRPGLLLSEIIARLYH
jgi:hypothetical protein